MRHQLRGLESVGFRAIRKLVLRPLARWKDQLEVVEQLEALKSLGRGVIVNGPLRLGNPGNTEFAEDVSINAGLVVRGSGALKVGAHAHFGEDVEILTSNHNFDRPETLPYDKQRIARDVVVGECVWFGDRVIVVPGVVIGDGAVLAAGAVVTRNVPPMAVVGGSPAKVIRLRDQAAFEELSAAGKFLGWPRDYDLINDRRMKLRRRG